MALFIENPYHPESTELQLKGDNRVPPPYTPERAKTPPHTPAAQKARQR